MKKKNFFRIVPVVTTFFCCHISSAQTEMDTVKTGKANDPMVVDPGKVNDGSVVNPGKTNDAMAAFSDTGFISKNIADNLMEIRLAKLAQTKGTSAQLKKVAALMVSDHTVILNDLKKLAAKKAISPSNSIHSSPSMPMSMPSGSSFDKTWASEMLTMHEAKIAELENYINSSADEDIKAAASRALQRIKMHRDLLLKIPGAKAKTGVA